MYLFWETPRTTFFLVDFWLWIRQFDILLPVNSKETHKRDNHLACEILVHSPSMKVNSNVNISILIMFCLTSFSFVNFTWSCENTPNNSSCLFLLLSLIVHLLVLFSSICVIWTVRADFILLSFNCIFHSGVVPSATIEGFAPILRTVLVVCWAAVFMFPSQIKKLCFCLALSVLDFCI